MFERLEEIDRKLTDLDNDQLDEVLDKLDAIQEKLDEDIGYKSKPITTVLDDFRSRKFEEVESQSQYNRKLDYLQEFLMECSGIQSTDDLSSEDIEAYEHWRKYESLDRDRPLGGSTLQDDMYLFREFVRYLIQHNLAPPRFEHLVQIPTIDNGKNSGVDTKKLTATRSREILDYLRKYERVTVDHIIFELMCEAGPRKSDLFALDVNDFVPNEDSPQLNFKHRENTPLKNDSKSERSITLYDDVPGLLQEFIELKRPETVDKFGRYPLLTTGDGRIGKSTIKKIAYMWTRPCQIGKDCPHERNPKSCTAAKFNNKAYECPSSRAPHHVRKGYITAKRSAGVPIDSISYRCDVSPRVLKKHYDLPTLDEERGRHDDEFRNSRNSSASGFSHNE